MNLGKLVPLAFGKTINNFSSKRVLDVPIAEKNRKLIICPDRNLNKNLPIRTDRIAVPFMSDKSNLKYLESTPQKISNSNSKGKFLVNRSNSFKINNAFEFYTEI